MTDTRTSEGSREFTIAEAIEEYRADRHSGSGIDGLADFLVKQGTEINDYPNDDYLDALRLTKMMFRNTEKNFVILTGAGCDGGFYITLWEELTAALDRIRQAGGKGQMILLSNQYPEWLKALAEDYQGTFEVATTAPDPLRKHFIVCDSKMVREEELHGELTPDSRADQIKAKVHTNRPEKVKVLEDEFKSIWAAPATAKSIPERRTKAPSWLVYQMEASRQQRQFPTSAEVGEQFRSVEATRTS